jgi:hypothetical protein
VSLAALPGGRVAVSGGVARGDRSAAGLAVLDAAGHQEWLVVDEGQRGSPFGEGDLGRGPAGGVLGNGRLRSACVGAPALRNAESSRVIQPRASQTGSLRGRQPGQLTFDHPNDLRIPALSGKVQGRHASVVENSGVASGFE